MPATLPTSTLNLPAVSGELRGLAADLRQAFERALAGRDGSTPLSFAFSPGQFRLLTAGAAQIFSPEETRSLIDALGEWGRSHLGAAHVSTPQLRVYCAGCRRGLLSDATVAEWRYCYSLTRANGAAEMALLDRPVLEAQRRFGKLHKFGLDFGDLIVHRTRAAYSIKVDKSPEPAEGAVFLDGFFW